MYLKLSPVLIYGWLDDLGLDEIENIISSCALIIKYSLHIPEINVITKFNKYWHISVIRIGPCA